MTSSRRIYRQFAIWFLVTLAWLGGSAKVQAEDFLENVETSFNIHGYLENQEIIRNENFVKNYHVASIRSRLDVQPSGQLFKDLDFGPITKGSVSYFVELRPGYEGAYDIVNDRFGNRPTGFSGTGFSPFSGPPISNGAGVALLRLFGYDVKRFKFYGARNFAFPEPVAPNAVFLIPCVHCGNVNVTENDLKFERDDSNRDYYPLREAYLDIGGDLLGQNLLRIGKQQIVWGKADFFRLQDIIDPVDFAQHFFIEPFEDTRVPKLSAWLQHRFGDVGFLHDLAANFVWDFDQFIPVGLGQGGQPWAVEFGDAKRAFAFNNGLFTDALCLGGTNCNPNTINFALARENLPQWRFRNDGVGFKWDWEIPQGVRFALTDYWAIRDTPAFKNTKLNVINGACTGLATITGGVPVTLGSGLPLTVVRPSSVHLKPGIRPDRFLDNCTLGGEIQIFYHRVNTLGLSADYFEPRSGLVFRVESSWTHNALVNDTDSLTLTNHQDILAYVLGLDLPHFIHFLNPDRTFFTSFQVFETYYPGAHSTDGGKRGIITGVNDFTLTLFTQTHYYRDQIIPLLFGAFGTEGTDATVGGNVEWLLTDHWSATLGFDAFLGKSHQHDLGTFTQFNRGNPFSESAFGAGHMQAGGAERNVMDEFWTRIRFRF